jgi:hypothetical protein
MRVEKMVRRVVGGCAPKVHGHRLNAVAQIAEGIIKAGRVSPASIGRSLEGSPKHGIKRADRLLGNPRLASERLYFFHVIANVMLSDCPRPVVLVDWTQVMGTHQALVAAVPLGGRAVPVYIEVHRQKKLGNTKVERQFLSALKALLPTGCRPIIVSDAGFKGPFFKAVTKLAWDFVGRIRGTSKARRVGSEQLISKAEFYAQSSPGAKDLGPHELFSKQRIPARLVLFRNRRRPGPKPPPPKCKELREVRQAALDPWLLATSLETGTAQDIVSLYAKRMQIEETFRDAKNHRFGWSLSHVRTACISRAATLLLLVSIAMLVVTLVGLAADASCSFRGSQVPEFLGIPQP